MAEIIAYTDGSSKGNPGKGGYGIVLMAGAYRKELSQGYTLTTNNRMELLAVIVALESLLKPNSTITIYSDSKYVIDSITKGWIFSWIKKPNFGGKKNQDLWERFLRIYPKHTVKFEWVKGHSTNDLNNRADDLATSCTDNGIPLKEDEGYAK